MFIKAPIQSKEFNEAIKKKRAEHMAFIEASNKRFDEALEEGRKKKKNLRTGCKGTKRG